MFWYKRQLIGFYNRIFCDYYSTQLHAKITQNIDKFFNDKQNGIVCCMKNELYIGIVTISCSKREGGKLTQPKIYEIFSQRDEKNVAIYVIFECFLNDTISAEKTWSAITKNYAAESTIFFLIDITIYFQPKNFVSSRLFSFSWIFHPISFSPVPMYTCPSAATWLLCFI